MPRSTDIKLSLTYSPTFPDRCIGCGLPAPGNSYQARVKAVAAERGGHVTVDVPACAACKPRLRRQRLLEAALNWVVAGIGVAVAMWLLKSYDGPFKKWLAAGIAAVGFLPFVVWRILFPLPFAMTAFADTVTYEFLDRTYAEEFALRNSRPDG